MRLRRPVTIPYLVGTATQAGKPLVLNLSGEVVLGEDATAGTVPEAPVDGTQYGREDAGWTVIAAGGVTDHALLTNVTTSQHHVRYSDAEAVAAVGPHTPAQTFLHADLTDVATDQHHAKYTDGEAVAAMGLVGDLNPLNHDRYTDGEADARAALQDHDHATPIANHTTLADAHHSRYTDGEAVTAVGPHTPAQTFLHADLTDVTAAQHHARYTDGEAVAAVGPIPAAQTFLHADLTDVSASQHHTRYVDSEAVTAMGLVGDTNPLNHDRYTDGEAVTAVGPHTPAQTYLHADLTDVTTDQHHAQVHLTAGSDHSSTGALSGKVLTADGLGGQTWKTPASGVTDHALLDNVTASQHHARYTDAEAVAAVGTIPAAQTFHHADLTDVSTSQHHVRYADTEAVTAMGVKGDSNALNHDRYTDAEAVAAVGSPGAGIYLPLSGGKMTGPIDMSAYDLSGIYKLIGTAGGFGIRNSADAIRQYFFGNDAIVFYKADGTTPSLTWDVPVGVDPPGENWEFTSEEVRVVSPVAATQFLRFSNPTGNPQILFAGSPSTVTPDITFWPQADALILRAGQAGGAITLWTADDPAYPSGVRITGWDNLILVGDTHVDTGDLVVDGYLTVGNDLALDGGVFRSSVLAGISGSGIVIDSLYPTQEITFYSADENEQSAGGIFASVVEPFSLYIGSAVPVGVGRNNASILIKSDDAAGNVDSLITVSARRIELSATSSIYAATSLTVNGAVMANDGTAGAPTLRFAGDDNTGLYLYGANVVGFGVGTVNPVNISSSYAGGILRINGGNLSNSNATSGNAALAISDATSDRAATDTQLLFGVDASWGAWIQSHKPGTGSKRLLINPNGGIVSLGPGVYNNPTGSAANLFIGTSSSNALFRESSARKYKSRITYNVDYLADYELKPAKFYRKDDKRWFIGFIADDLGEQNELLGQYEDGEIENFDQRALLAVMAAKINRLEALAGVG